MKIHKGRRFRWGKAVLSYLLILSMVLGLIPQSAYAAETETASTNEVYEDEGFTITYEEETAWGEYVNVNITLQNNTDHAKSLWKLTFDYEGQIDSIWNADIVSSEKNKYVVAAKNYNSTIGAGQSVSFGFTAHGTDKKVSAPKKIQFVKESGSEGSSEGSTEEGGSTETGGESGDEDVPEQGYVIPEKWNGLNYALFTSGENELSLCTGSTDIIGSVHTNQDFYYQGGTIRIDGTLEAGRSITLRTSDSTMAQDIGTKRENCEILDMPDITQEVSEYIREKGTVYEEDIDFGSDPIVIEQPLYGAGKMAFHATSFQGQGIVYATDSVTVDAGNLTTPSDSKIFLASEKGDITLNGSDISFNGILYAPNGCVYINANALSLNGRIIAKQVIFQGTELCIKKGNNDLDMISFLFPENMMPIAKLKTEDSYVRDENGVAHIEIEDLSEVSNSFDLSQILYVIYYDADGNGEFADEESVDTVSSMEKLVPVELTKVGNYKIVQKLLLTDGTETATTDEESAYFEIRNQKPKADIQLERDVKVDVLLLHNDLDEYGKNQIQGLKTSLEEAGKEQGICLNVTPKELALPKKEFKWTVFDHKNYDSDDNHVTQEEDGFSFRSYESDPLTDFVYAETEMGKNQEITFTIKQQEDSFDVAEGSGLIFGASVESVEHPECYRNHRYEVINEYKRWELAKETCKSLGGYLATITSEWEKDYIEEHVLPEKREFIYWLGGYRDEKVPSVWKWVTGEDFYWTNWDYGEPNYLGNGENNLELYGNRKPVGVWNDAYPTAEIPFLCEWDGPHMSGYTLLLTDEGMKLLALDDVDMDNLRNGSYARMESAGTLLGTFPYDMDTKEHHITIERNDNEVTIIDNDNVIVENFVLNVSLKGTGIAPVVSYKRQNSEEIRECVTISQPQVKEKTNQVVQNAVKEYEWEKGARRILIHVSEGETEEYRSDVNTASLIQYLLEQQIEFIGKGKKNIMAFTRTHAAVDGIIADTDDDILEYINQILKKADKTVGQYITPEDSVLCKLQYEDPENDPLLKQEWTYEYWNGMISEENQKHVETIKRDEPMYQFNQYGSYRIRLKVQDNPVGENEALSDYRLWSEASEWDKVLYIHHIPKASLQVSKEIMNNRCNLSILMSGYDEDHMEDENKGIIKEYNAYKELDDIEWTEGRITDTVECGKIYLVKYAVEDKENVRSAPEVAVIDTSIRNVIDASEDQEAPKVVLRTSSDKAELNDVVQITAYASDNYGIKNFSVTINGEKVLDNAGTLQYSCYEEGTVEIIAKAEDFNHNQTVERKLIVVGNQNTPPDTMPSDQLSEEEKKQLISAKQSAIKWLKDQADENGVWNQDGLMHTTCDALTVLRIAGEPMESKGYDAWVAAGQDGMNIDEQCHALLVNPDKEGMTRLWEQQNADGGFGLTPTYTSDLYDTLLVLRTEFYLRKQGIATASGEQLTGALAYIANHRNADGGFGYNEMDNSREEFCAEYYLYILRSGLTLKDDTLKKYCQDAYTGEFTEDNFIKQVMLARVKQQSEPDTFSKENCGKLLSLQKEDGSIYESVEDTMLYIVLLDEMIKEGE